MHRMSERLTAIEAKQDRILAMLDSLLDALLHEDEPEEQAPLLDMDGNTHA